MNVFVLCSGRCGSVTFIKACKHIINYSADHESRSHLLGDEHFKYPKKHIEADNRLSWFLGRLDKAFGDDAFYVHLKRNEIDTANSFKKRYNNGIIKAYRKKILMKITSGSDPLDVALDYYNTVNSNIELFLKDKTKKMTFSLENAKMDFRSFWNSIGAEGSLKFALSEWDVYHNASVEINFNFKKKLKFLNQITISRIL